MAQQILAALDDESLMNLEEYLYREDGGGSSNSSVHAREENAAPHDPLMLEPSLSMMLDPASHGVARSGAVSFPIFPPPVLNSPSGASVDDMSSASPMMTRRSSTASCPPPSKKRRRAVKEEVKEEPRDEGEYSDAGSDAGDDMSFQPRVRWTVNESETWHRIFDINMTEIPQPGFRVEIDKGFKQSIVDGAFVCQKKNHFQLTVIAKMNAEPAYIATRKGLLKINGLVVNLYGIKVENPSHHVMLGQSQSDRSKHPFSPIPVTLRPGEVTKICVGRLHFFETTGNNMRKKGKRNPEQRFFALVVTLAAQVGNELHSIASHVSDKIIVRASNPGQFETDSNTSWVRGNTVDSIYHIGAVGVNTDTPDEALAVDGNIRLTGAVLQPSDVRLKHNFQPADTSLQLKAVRNLPLYRYELRPEWARHVGRTDSAGEFGVLAQDVQREIPDAVKVTPRTVHMDGGHSIENLLTVNKERIFMEGLGAVQELSKLTEQLEASLQAVRAENKTLRRALYRSSSLQEVHAHLRAHEDGSDADDLLLLQQPGHMRHPDVSLWAGWFTMLLVALLAVAFSVSMTVLIPGASSVLLGPPGQTYYGSIPPCDDGWNLSRST